MENNLDVIGLIAFFSLIGPLFGLILTGMTIWIASIAYRRFPGTPSRLIAIGVILKTIYYFSSYYTDYFLLRRIPYDDISVYFIANNILASIGSFIFLLGLLLLLQKLYRDRLVAEMG